MKLLQAIGVRTVTVVVALGALELGLRPFGWGAWTVNELSERYGWRMLPDQHTRSRDLSVAEDINSWGFRDREWTPPRRDASGAWVKDDAVFRVAVVGNSMTYGTSVPIEATWPRVLEDRLRADFAARGVAREPLVMNFAVQGYVFEQMARVYEDLIRPWRPDLLLLPTHPHDITPMKPAQDDPDYEFRDWILRSATYDLLQTHVINRWIPAAPPPRPASRAEAGQLTPAEWQALDGFITEQPFNRGHDRYWKAMAARVDEVRAQVEQDGGRLAIVTLPRFRDLFEPKLMKASGKWIPWVMERPTTLHMEPLPAFRPAMEALRAEIEARGIPHASTHDLSTLTYVDASGAEQPADRLDRAADALFFLRDTGHYTAEGHRLLADAVTADLQRAGWLPAN
ncbi:MAG: hypothetical protein FJ296_01320 [Planctomycetes bacterium]|nr:hypothetical protein [Planctomycetota bacterium]